MIIKWCKDIARINNTDIKLDQDILNAGTFNKWYVIATKTNLYFIGKDPYIFSIPLVSVVFTDHFIYYHSREDKNIYKIRHPLEEEVFLFYSPHYVLWNVIVHEGIGKVEEPTFILRKNRTYIIKKTKSYYLYFIRLEDRIKHVIKECSFEEFIGLKNISHKSSPDDELQINSDDPKEGIEFMNKVNSSLDDKITNLMVEDSFYVYVFVDYLVIVSDNLVTFVDFLNFTERNIQIVNNAKSRSHVFDKPIDIYRPIRIILREDRDFNIVQINNRLFYKNEVIKMLSENTHFNAFEKVELQSNYYPVFWKKPSALDKRCMSILNTEDIIKLVENCIDTNEYNFQLARLSFTQLNMINEYLEEYLIKCETLGKFIERCKHYMSLDNVFILEKLKKLYQRKKYFTASKDYDTLLGIKYERIFEYNSRILTNMKFSKIGNLAFQIICLEMSKNQASAKNKFGAKKWEKYKKLFYEYFKDARMDEVNSLFDEKPKKFNFDSEAENINEKAYVLRLSCNLGKSLAFYDSVRRKDVFKTAHLVYPVYKDSGLVNIEVKEKNWRNWPLFHYSCYYCLSASNLIEITTCFIENKLKSFIKQGEESEHRLGGFLFAFGLRNKYKNIRIEEVKHLITDTLPFVSMILLISIGLSNKGMHNQELFEALSSQLKIETHLYIKIGYLIGTSYTYMNSRNVNLKNLLIDEINNKSAMDSEKYNKNNTMCQDETYRLVLGLMLTYILRDKNHKPYEFLVFKDKLLELLINGLIHFDTQTQRHISKFERTVDDSLEEIFYSEFFTLSFGDNRNFNEIHSEIKQNIGNMQVSDIYRYAGRIFYMGVFTVINEINLSKSEFMNLYKTCLVLEEKMLKEEVYRILFDYCLISLCLIKNSTCNLDLIKIIRRQIKRIEKNTLNRNKIDYIFTSKGIIKELQTTLTYGQIENYKLCLGILNLGLSRFRIRRNVNTIIDLVITFYIKWPICTQDQDYFSILRYNIFNSLDMNNASCFKSICKFKSKSTKNVSHYFKKRFERLSEFDKKFVVDILSDYYENYHEEDYLIDVEYFKDQVIRCI